MSTEPMIDANGPKPRAILLRPEPDLAAMIDAAARDDRRTPPQWILHTLQQVLDGRGVGAASSASGNGRGAPEVVVS